MLSTIIGIALGGPALLGLIYALIRLYVASRINRRHRFCEELVFGDVVYLPLESMRRAARAGGEAHNAARTQDSTTGQGIALHDGTGV